MGSVPDRLELPLSGPIFERALVLARHAVIEGIIGGPGLEPTLEPVLTEAANDRAVGALLTFLLVGLASQAAAAAAAADLDDGGPEPSEQAVGEHAVALIDELVASFRRPASPAP
jgi:hypothetical protein